MLICCVASALLWGVPSQPPLPLYAQHYFPHLLYSPSSSSWGFKRGQARAALTVSYLPIHTQTHTYTLYMDVQTFVGPKDTHIRPKQPLEKPSAEIRKISRRRTLLPTTSTNSVGVSAASAPSALLLLPNQEARRERQLNSSYDASTSAVAATYWSQGRVAQTQAQLLLPAAF